MPLLPAKEGIPDVPAQVFGKFLHALADASAPAELISRLRTTLLEDKTFSERALKAAVLGEEPLP